MTANVRSCQKQTRRGKLVIFGNGLFAESAVSYYFTCAKGMEVHPFMDTITISNVDDDLKHRLEARAAQHGHSVETEARDILRSALTEATGKTASTPQNLADAIRAIVEPLGGIDLQIAPRKPVRVPPTFA